MSLGQLRRSPGKDEGWVESALSALEQDRPVIYERLRRQLGFALRLAELATLQVQERAGLALGLFFHELAGERLREGPQRPSRPWVEYLLRNDSWLAHSFHIAEALDSPGWTDEEDPAIVIAKVAVTYDFETTERHSRPLVVMQQMFVEANTPAAEQIMPILWTEDGQELCDHHFRRQPYRVDVKEIKRAFEVLRRAAPRALIEVPAAPMRFSTPTAAAAIETKRSGRADDGEVMARPQRPAARRDESAEFERRRQALRAGPGWGAILGDPSSASDDDQRQPPSAPEPEEEETDSELWVPPQPMPEPERPIPIPAETPQEAPSMTMRSILPAGAGRNDHADITTKVEELRAQLERIQRTTIDAQRVLDSLAPQLEEFGSWVADLEAVVGRWQARDERQDRVA